MKTPLLIACTHFDLPTGCQVRIQAPRSWRSGDVHNVSIELIIPGGVVHSNSARTAPEHADVCVALRDAFDNTARQLQQFKQAI